MVPTVVRAILDAEGKIMKLKEAIVQVSGTDLAI